MASPHGDPCDIPELLEAITGLRAELARMPLQHPDRAPYLLELSQALHTLAQCSGEFPPLREAVAVGLDAVRATARVPKDDPLHEISRVNYRNALASVADWTTEVDDLRALVSADRDLLAAAPRNHPERVAMLCLLWTDLAALVDRVDEPGLVAEIIDVARQAVAATPLNDADHAGALADLTGTLLGGFERSYAVDVLADGVRTGREFLRRYPVDHPMRGQVLTLLGRAIGLAEPHLTGVEDVYRLLDDTELIREILGNARSALTTATTAAERAEASQQFCRAARLLTERVPDTALSAEIVDVARSGANAAGPDDALRQTLSLEMLFAWLALSGRNPAATATESVIRTTLASFPEAVASIADLLATSRGLRTLLDNTADDSALRRAVGVARMLLTGLDSHDPRRPGQLQILSTLLQLLFEQTSEPALTEQAVTTAREAYALAAESGCVPNDLLVNLAAALEQRVDATTDPAVLTEALAVWRELVAATAGSPQHNDYLGNYANLLHKRLTQRMDDIESLHELRRTLDAMEPGQVNPIATMVMTALGYVLDSKPNIAAAQQQAQWARESLASLALGECDRATATGARGLLLLVLGRATRDRTVLAEAVDIARDAVAIFPENDPDRVAALLTLTVALVLWFDETGELDALHDAARISRDELSQVPLDAPERATCLSVAALVVGRLAERTNNSDARHEALQLGRSSAAASRHGGVIQAGMVSRVSGVLGSSYRATGDLSLLDEAVRIARAAVAACPPDASEYHVLLNDLGRELGQLYDRSDDPAHLTEAIDRQRAAVAACPPQHPDHPAMQVDLSISLSRSFERNQNAADIDEAITVCRNAIATYSGAGPLLRAAVLSILAGHLHDQFYATFDEPIGNECLQLRRQALALTPEDHVLWPERQGLLGAELAQRLMLTQDRRLLPQTLTALRAATVSPIAPVSVRIMAARLLEFAEVMAGNHEKALAALELVIELLPLTATRALARSDREYHLSRQSGLAAAAAAAAVAVGRPQRAVELLEHCRGVLLGEAMEDRRDFSALAAVAPELAAELTDVRTELITTEDALRVNHRSAPSEDDLAAISRLGDRRRDLARRWEILLERARVLPGFDRLLRPPDLGTLRRHRLEGPIVMIFVHLPPTGGHALIIPADPEQPIRAVPLPTLTVTGRIEQLQRLDEVIAGPHNSLAARSRAGEQLHQQLEWMWDTIASPILEALDIRDAVEEPPRVWWCPIGDLAFLPIQAAGYHRQSGARTVLDRTVSSFITTLRTLDQGPETSTPGSDSTLIISVPKAPGATELQGVGREVAQVAALLSKPEILEDHEATKDAVAQALRRHPHVLLACHAVDDPFEPTASRFLLHDHLTDPFSVATLLGLHLEHAGLAYLSACSTTRTTPLLADEAIHLTASIHLAGFRHVIGTLWPINDGAAANISGDFYRILTDEGRTPPRTQLCARALNEAVRRERDQYLSSPSRWAAHLHYGL